MGQTSGNKRKSFSESRISNLDLRQRQFCIEKYLNELNKNIWLTDFRSGQMPVSRSSSPWASPGVGWSPWPATTSSETTSLGTPSWWPWVTVSPVSLQASSSLVRVVKDYIVLVKKIFPRHHRFHGSWAWSGGQGCCSSRLFILLFLHRKSSFYCFRSRSGLYSLPWGRVQDADISTLECSLLYDASISGLRHPVLHHRDSHHHPHGPVSSAQACPIVL